MYPSPIPLGTGGILPPLGVARGFHAGNLHGISRFGAWNTQGLMMLFVTPISRVAGMKRSLMFPPTLFAAADDDASRGQTSP